MPTVFGTVYCDTPYAKVFDLVADENDAVATPTAMVFGAGGMGNFDALPEIKFMVDVSNVAANTSVTHTLSIYGVTTFGFTTLTTSVAGLNAVDHTYRVYMFSREFFQF